LHDVPSVVFGKATFDPATRRVIGVKSVNLVVENGEWALLGSKAAVAAK
jgi:branched-chain amino acid transport system substrate-binding protein